MSSDSRLYPAGVRSARLVVTLATLLVVSMLGLPAAAAPPVTSITDVTVSGTPNGADGCVWRMEVTIENFRGGGKNFFASLGSPASTLLLTTADVKGKVTTFVWEESASLLFFPSVDKWAVRAENNKGLQDMVTATAVNVECGV